MQSDTPTFSLRWKIVLIGCVTAGLSALLIAGISYFSMRDLARDKAIENFAHQTEVAAYKVTALYEQMKNDLFAISGTAAVVDMIGAIRNNGINPQDGATIGQLRSRLHSAFAAVMRERQHYTRMRYVGIADNGRELARVGRQPDGTLRAVASDELQEKGSEVYFKESLGLAQGAYYISRVAYTSGPGAGDTSQTPTIRMVMPVFSPTGERFGVIVITANYELLLKQALQEIPLGQTVYISDTSGAFIRRDPQGRITALEVAGAYRAIPPRFIEDFVAERLSEGTFQTADQIGYCRRVNVATGQHYGWIGVMFLTPRERLFDEANTLIQQNLTNALIITIAAGLLAAFLANLHTWPIRRITAAIEAYSHSRGSQLDLPVDAKDEVGVMARAFQSLTEKLEASDQRSASLSLQLDRFIEIAVDGVIIIDGKGAIEQINPAALEIFGYQRDELIGRNVSLLMPPPISGRHDEYLKTYASTGRQSFIGSIREVEGRKKDGSVMPLAISVTEMQLPNKRKVFGGIVRDMTELYAAQRSVAMYMAELERSNHELNQFAYVASHDLKAPLRVIDNASRWLEEDLSEKLTEEDRANMTLLRGRVGRMDRLLDDLLEYARIGKAEDARYREAVSLSTLIEDMLMLLDPPPAMRVSVPVEFGGIMVLRMPLQRIFHNLISNAIKHHDRPSGAIELSVEVFPERYLFFVKDDGPGIPVAYREIVFDMFRTLKPRDHVEGSGMGLAIVKKTVESAGGTITVTSEGERGAIFAFSWPREQVQEIAEHTGKAA